MTGQVKEEVLTRLGELGVRIKDGVVSFRPVLLEAGELLRDATLFSYFDVSGDAGSLELDPGTMAFTFCQVPIVYECVEREGWVHVTLDGGSESLLEGDCLRRELSSELLRRTGRIARIHVGIPRSALRGS